MHGVQISLTITMLSPLLSNIIWIYSKILGALFFLSLLNKNKMKNNSFKNPEQQNRVFWGKELALGFVYFFVSGVFRLVVCWFSLLFGVFLNFVGFLNGDHHKSSICLE